MSLAIGDRPPCCVRFEAEYGEQRDGHHCHCSCHFEDRDTCPEADDVDAV